MGSRDSLGKTLGSVLFTLLLTLSVAAIEQNITLSLPPVVVHGPRPHVLYNAGKTEYLRCLATGAQPIDCDSVDNAIQRLQCEARGSPPLRYDWYRDGQLLSFNDSMYQRHSDQPGTLIVRTKTSITDGYYQCKASNDAGIAISNITLLQEAVLRRVGGREVKVDEVDEGNDLTLACDHIESVPADSVTYEWHRAPDTKQPPSGRILPTERISFDRQGHLVFANVLPEDSLNGHIYKCKASNPHKREQKFGSYYNVTVRKRAHDHGLVPRLIYHSDSPSVVLEGQPVTLQCVFSGVPTPTVVWEPPGGTSPRAHTEFSREYRISRVKFQDAGYYQCKGNNSAGSSDPHKILLEVEAAPSWLHRPQSQNVTEGSTVHFRCEAHGKPAPSVTWYHNDQPINSTYSSTRNLNGSQWSVGEEGHLLTIHDVALNDTSTVHCNVSNRHGYKLTGAYLRVISQPYITTENYAEIQVSITTSADINNTTSTTTTPTTTATTTQLTSTSDDMEIDNTTKEVKKSGSPNVVQEIQISPGEDTGQGGGISLSYIVFPPVFILALILLILVIFLVRRKRKQSRSYSVTGREKRLGRIRWRKRDYDSDDSGYNGEDERPMRSRVQVIDITEVEPSPSDHLDPTPIKC